MTFITDNFLLHNEFGRELYHQHAKNQPIFDYHCHIPPADIARDRRFENLFDIWLAGDHYKWRAMRANGVAERFCTGDADPYEKFLAWARTVPETLRNPLYHWTHLELKRYFGIDTLLNEETAKDIWDEANKKLKGLDFSVHGILEKFKVVLVCTTDDPTDDLEYHRTIANLEFPTRVYPAFRPDNALRVNDLELFSPWVEKLQERSGIDCAKLSGMQNALRQRHDFFHEMGSRLSDHGMERVYAEPCSEEEASAIYQQACTGTAATLEQFERFASWMMLFLGRLDAEKGWTKQLHLGALRNQNPKLFRTSGADVGGDSIGDFRQVESLGRYLGTLEAEDALPRLILYNNNPNDNYPFATMIGNFQGGGIPGKLQLGSGWWYLDQKEAMEWQMNTLSNVGLFSRFVGMLTDSRSFMSYPRHEYFRRVLCNLIGRDVEHGELPRDMQLLGNLVENISFNNAKNYFGMEIGER